MIWIIILLVICILVPALVSLIPGAWKDKEVMRDWCEVCTRW